MSVKILNAKAIVIAVLNFLLTSGMELKELVAFKSPFRAVVATLSRSRDFRLRVTEWGVHKFRNVVRQNENDFSTPTPSNALVCMQFALLLVVLMVLGSSECFRDVFSLVRVRLTSLEWLSIFATSWMNELWVEVCFELRENRLCLLVIFVRWNNCWIFIWNYFSLFLVFRVTVFAIVYCESCKLNRKKKGEMSYDIKIRLHRDMLMNSESIFLNTVWVYLLIFFSSIRN